MRAGRSRFGAVPERRKTVPEWRGTVPPHGTFPGTAGTVRNGPKFFTYTSRSTYENSFPERSGTKRQFRSVPTFPSLKGWNGRTGCPEDVKYGAYSGAKRGFLGRHP